MRKLAGAVLVAAAILVPATTGFFFYRDNLSTHYPAKVITAASLEQGEIPFWNFATQRPLAGNPNFLTFYPDTLLFLFLPPTVAFNLHFLLHWLIGGFGVLLLLRELGATRETSVTMSVLYLASGAVISTGAFYNLVTASAWIPFALLFAEKIADKPAIRDAVLLGGVLGLIGLAGEPTIVAATGLAALVVVAGRITAPLVGFGSLALLIALIVASPQIAAFLEIARSVERGTRAYSLETVLNASMTPAQFLDLVAGPWRGSALDLTPNGLVASISHTWPPLFGSLHLGAVIIPAVAGAAALPGSSLIVRHRYLFAAGILSFLALGRFNPFVVLILDTFETLRIGRYPEKLALPLTLVLLVLAARFLDRLEPLKRSQRIALALVAASFAILAVVQTQSASQADRVRLTAGSVIAVVTIVLLARRHHPQWKRLAIAAIVVPPILWAAMTIPLDWRAPYARSSPIVARAAQEQRIFHADDPIFSPLPEPDERSRYRLAAATALPAWGSHAAVSYALDRSPDGIGSILSRIARERSDTSPSNALRYLRIAGATAILDGPRERFPGARPIETYDVGGQRWTLRAIDGALPNVQSVERLAGAASVDEAVRMIETASFDPATTAIVPHSVTTQPELAKVRAVRFGRDRVAFEIEAPGDAFVVVNQAWFPAWSATARSGSTTVALEPIPVNLDRIGLRIPGGAWTIELTFGRYRPLITALATLSLLTLVLIGIFATGRFIEKRDRSPGEIERPADHDRALRG